MKIPKMCLKQYFFYSKWVLQAILSQSLQTMFLAGQILISLFSLIVPNFVELF